MINPHHTLFKKKTEKTLGLIIDQSIQAAPSGSQLRSSAVDCPHMQNHGFCTNESGQHVRAVPSVQTLPKCAQHEIGLQVCDLECHVLHT